MSKFSILFYGITISSVILASEACKNSNQTIAANIQSSNLALMANGEDFVRPGFVSKDGGKISFDRVYVNISGETIGFQDFATKLSSQIYQKLTQAIVGLSHIGGHYAI